MDALPDPAQRLADAVGPALSVVLATLTPGERIAYVLHDVFGIPYELIAALLDRPPATARALAARARRQVRATMP